MEKLRESRRKLWKTLDRDAFLHRFETKAQSTVYSKHIILITITNVQWTYIPKNTHSLSSLESTFYTMVHHLCLSLCANSHPWHNFLVAPDPLLTAQLPHLPGIYATSSKRRNFLITPCPAPVSLFGHSPIANLVRNNHVFFELPLECGRIELADQVEVVGEILEDGLEQRRLIAVQEELLFETNAVITDHRCARSGSGCLSFYCYGNKDSLLVSIRLGCRSFPLLRCLLRFKNHFCLFWQSLRPARWAQTTAISWSAYDSHAMTSERILVKTFYFFQNQLRVFFFVVALNGSRFGLSRLFHALARF